MLFRSVVAEEHAKASSRAQQLSQFLLTAGETIRALPLVGPLSRRWGEVQSASLGSRRAGMVEQSNMQNTIQMVGQLLTVVVYVPALHAPFGTYALPFEDWLIVGLTALSVIPVLEAGKWLIRRKGW